MYARLWAKESRQFAPLWLFLIGCAAGLLWFLNQFQERVWARDLEWGPLAYCLCWSALYAATAGAAAFAGERETKTLVLLDALAVPRSTLWTAKTLFAFGSTALVAVVLAAIAEHATGDHGAPIFGPHGYVIAAQTAPLVISALCWGLFWSSIAGSALAAAGLTIATVTVDFTVVRFLSQAAAGGPGPLPAAGYGAPSATASLVLSGLALLASRHLMTRNHRSSGAGSPPSPVRALKVSEERTQARPFLPEWVSPARRIFWQANRAQRTEWRWAAAITAVALFQCFALGAGDESNLLGLVTAVSSLLIGVGVFSHESLSGGHRFLANHGASPLGVWIIRQLAGIFKIGLLWAGSAFVLTQSRPSEAAVYTFSPMLVALAGQGVAILPLLLGSLALHVYSAGQLAGLLIRRPITAAVAAVGLSMLTFTPTLLLVGSGYAPVWSFAIAPAALLLISGALVGGWVRGGATVGRAIVAAVLTAATFALSTFGFSVYRREEVPNVEIEEPADLVLAFGPKQRESANRLERFVLGMEPPAGGWIDREKMPGRVAEPFDPNSAYADAVWQKNRVRLAAAIQAASERESPLASIAAMDDPRSAPLWLSSLDRACTLLNREAAVRLAEGELESAWDAIDALLVLGERMSKGATRARLEGAQYVRTEACRRAIECLSHNKLTQPLLEKVLREIPATSLGGGLEESIQVERFIADRVLARLKRDPSHASTPAGGGALGVVERLPWEIDRARRLIKVLARYAIDEQRVGASGPLAEVIYGPRVGASPSRTVSFDGKLLSTEEIERLLKTTPLAALFPSESHEKSLQGLQHEKREQMYRNALAALARIRQWQFERDPRMVISADPSAEDQWLLWDLPVDPYGPSPGRSLLARIAGQAPTILGSRNPDFTRRPGPGKPFFYSVGPNGKDEGGTGDDIVFPIPDSPYDGGEKN